MGSRQGAGMSIPYNVAFWLKAMVLSSFLKSSADICDVILQSVRVLLPPCLLAHFEQVLTECRDILPHKGTVSRWRLLLDGALMITQRRENEVFPNKSCIRYSMVDSSMQYGRDFEVIVCRTVRLESLMEMWDIATELVSLWRFRALFDCVLSPP